jgi:ubiquinone/menaquinone biosynthesis C-methylase UbiE
MTEATGFTSSSVPARYDSLYVPRLFEPWAELLLDRVAPRAGESLLDVACGPGTVARRAAARVGASGRVVASDFSAAMIEVARHKPPVDGATIEYVVSPAAPLAVPDAAFDVVTCQQGLQFFPDRAAAVAEMRRAAKAGGRIAIACWSAVELCPFFGALVDGIDAAAPGLAAQLRSAFSLPSADELTRLCREAGLRAIECERHERPLVFEGGLAQALRGVSASPAGPQVDALPSAQREAVLAEVTRRLQPFVDAEGAVRSTMVSNLALAVR